MTMFVFDPNLIFAFALAGTIVSLLLEYFPKLSGWFNALPDNTQKLVVLASGFVVVLGSFGLVCLGVFIIPWICTTLGLMDVLVAYLAFIFASQGTYLVTPKRSK
jgi:hypothetical protein